MRVRISYGIDIRDIPEQAETLGRDSATELQAALETLQRALDNIDECDNDYSLITSMLEKVRLKLTKTDLIITDLQAILEGLNNYYNGEQNVSERRPTLDPSGNPTTETKDNGEG